MEEISNKNQLIFEPSMVEALLRLSKKEYIWLDLISAAPVDQVFAIGNYEALVLDIDEVIRLTHIFSRVIDFRSKFTARHSAGVAVTAQKLAELVNFSLIECKMMLIAGFLHDIGKLAIDNEVLEKPAKLNTEEFNQMRSHTYYTYQILSMIPEFATIKVWASYHHEKLNGQGYPFHISAENLTLGSRIMAVADVFTAISENRPYREGMEDQKIKTVLTGMADNHFIDSYLVGLLLNNYETFNQVRIDAQHQAAIAYDDFLNSY
ncbi:3'3'-cGAMP-specific phosphodiesterase 1 [bioreactor metagenome]|uniref:3'3'-cGAMP-specific phosphodiesterase 1 n=1 Tax=bioreactor metagenome TaxID=1076179 RepID=A0A645DHL2_9ZZZZ